ncbi:MAG: DNA-directed RNA polymerase subunit beta, partial [Parcubacteria group bacterium]
MSQGAKTLGVKESFSPQSSLQKRKFFKRLPMVSLPNLIETQTVSYDWLLKDGLKELFEEVNPISDFTGKDLELTFGEYYLDEPKYDEKISKEKNISYEAPLRSAVKLLNKQTGEIKEQEVYLGDLPIMTDRGTFVINGVERVVVSQLIRSPGVFFTMEYQKGKRLFGAKIIPNRGAWLEMETDLDGALWVKIDRKRKVAVTSLLRAFGMASNEEIAKTFSDVNKGETNYIEATIERDAAKDQGEGFKEVYKRIRPGDLASVENAKQMIESMFFNFDRYDFGKVGRYRLNQRLDVDVPNDEKYRILRPEDLILIIKEIINLNNNPIAEPDDIDHLGNRRVRCVGELVQNKFRAGLARMARNIKDRMSTCDLATVVPGQLINSRPVAAAVKEFFASSQLSQFMDQVNPLAELEHKRRLSAMGPGGLT